MNKEEGYQEDLVRRSDEKYQSDYPSSNYLSNLNNLNKTNMSITLNRLPTLGEILANKTKSPVDLHTFYSFMRDVENRVEYLDFWFDLINHLNLCKHYVKGLRESIVRQSYHDNSAQQNRKSVPLSEKSKHRSLSSSILLDLIVNDNILEDTDSHRLSQFLRGDIDLDNVDPKLREVINQYADEESIRRSYGTEPNRKSTSPPDSPYYTPSPNLSRHTQEGKRVSSNSKLLDDQSFNESIVENQLEIGQAKQAANPKYVSLQQTRMSSINPSLLEKLIRQSPTASENHSFITRENLRESSHNLLLKYFVEDSEKSLYLPEELNSHVIKSIEVDGRDDPDVFNGVKVFVFNKIENDHLPKFLNFMAIRNVSHSTFIRMILGFFFLFIAFWISYIFIFLNYRKSIRPVVLIPYIIAFYCLVSSIYLIDPVLVWIGYSESFTNGRSLIRIREKFIRKLLFKRSLWVLFIILVLTAILTLIFSLVPGHRL